MERTDIAQVGVDDIIKASGFSVDEAKDFCRILKETIHVAKSSDPRDIWQEVVNKNVLKPWHPHGLHQLVYYSVYAHRDSSISGLPLYWFPSQYQAKNTNLGRVMETYGPKLLGTSYEDPIESFTLPEIHKLIILRNIGQLF